MSGSKKEKVPVYAWDTSVVLAWFKEEEDKPLEDMGLVIEEVERDKAKLIVSTIVYTEVLAHGPARDAALEFRQFLNRSNVYLANVDPRVAERAVEIREGVFARGE